MLRLGSFPSRNCGGVSRRAFLQWSSSAAAALALRAAPAHAAEPRAKSVIFLWLWGAPSHLDTLDPKPDAPAEYRGPFTAIPTRTPGLRFSELLPRLASRSHLFSVVRSHVTFAPGHPDAGTYGLTGFAETMRPLQPSFGSIAARHYGQTSDLMPFVSVGRGIPRDVVRIVDGYGGGKLGSAYDPFFVSCSDNGETDIPALKLLSGLTPLRLEDRHALLRHLDAARGELDASSFAAWSRQRARAYELLTSAAARQTLDVSREPAALRQAYGKTAFGQSCLLARRLVEAGVPFIQVNWSQYVEAMTPNCDFGWDTHIYNFELLQDMHGPIFDRALAALLDDLSARGLLDSTLVVAMGEFGRTPRISSRAARDHWPQCYCSLWAGAGVPGGAVIGTSDAKGENPITPPITPLMVGTTIAELSGVNAAARAELRVLDGGTLIRELVG